MMWLALLLAPLAVGALPTVQQPATNPFGIKDVDMLVYGTDAISPTLMHLAPMNERFKPDFDMIKWVDDNEKGIQGGHGQVGNESDPATGWSGLLEYNPAIVPWPSRRWWPNTPLHLVRYCFDDQETEQKLGPIVNAALKIWEDNLGFPGPNGNLNHALVFNHAGHHCLVKEENKPTYWNHMVDKDVLRIYTTKTPAPRNFATVGYRPLEKVFPGDHNLFIGQWDLQLPIIAPIIAHEFGHVIGMIHEHQRGDWDDNILFKCEKMKGYAEALSCVKSRGLPESMICTDLDVAKLCGFHIMRNYMVYGGKESTVMSIPYDAHSIMHYGSPGGGSASCTPNNLEECPISTYKDPMHHDKGTEFLYLPTKPSAIDLHFVQRYYPWKK